MKKTLASLLACAMLVASMPMAMAANPTTIKDLLTESGLSSVVGSATEVSVDMKVQSDSATFQDNLGLAKDPATTTLNFKADLDVAGLRASYDAYIEKLVALINANGGTEVDNLLNKLDAAVITGSFTAEITVDSGITMPAVSAIALSGDAASIFTMGTPTVAGNVYTVPFTVNADVTKTDFEAAFAAGNTLTLTCNGASVSAHGTYNVVATFSGSTEVWDETDKIAVLSYHTADPAVADSIEISISVPTSRPAGGTTTNPSLSGDVTTPAEELVITVPANVTEETYVVDETFEKGDEIQVVFKGEPTTIAIPVTAADAATVLVAVAEDDSETILKKAFVEDQKIIASLNSDVTIKVVDNSKYFVDVPADSWFAEPVDFVASREIFNGTAPQIFSPNGNMTRGMFAQVIHNIEYNPEATAEELFNDIAGHWSEDAVYWAASLGVVTGYPDGTYRANNNITREQIAAMLYRYAGSPDVEIDLGDFEDADEVSDYAKAAMSWAIAEGIITGVTSTTLKPGSNATRAQVAAMITRYIASLR